MFWTRAGKSESASDVSSDSEHRTPTAAPLATSPFTIITIHSDAGTLQ